MDAESLVKELILKSMTPEQQEAILNSVKTSVAQARAVQKQKIGENVDLVVQALKKIESDIRSRYDDLGNLIEKRVASIQDGRDGINGTDGRDGRDGKAGKDGAPGRQGPQGPAGKDGKDGVDGVSVTNAYLDFDGGLVITLSNGNEINVGEIVPMELASQIKVITNGGGTSQYVLDTLASLQTQINALIPSQTGNSGKFLTTNGISTSWASVAGGLSYQGTWNASTNTPTLASSTGTNGYYYIVSTAGSTNLNGITDWQIGDWLLFNGSVWQKIDQTNLVTSVNSQTGAVTLTYTDVNAIGSITSTDGSVNVSTASGVADLSVAVAASTTNVICQVRNTTGATLTKGTVVYISGATGQIPTVSKALANSDTTSAQTLGMLSADLANNSNGYVTIIGLVTGMDTSAYTDGAQLYLSPTTAGTYTTTKPYAPDHLVYVAIVEHAHPTQGKLFVKVQNGYELDELHNVSAQSPSNGQTIVYNSSTSLWEKNTVSLTAGVNGTLPVANGGTGLSSLTAGYIPFGNGTSALGSSANLFWDSVNSRLGVGTASPSRPLTIGTATAAYMLANGQTTGASYQSVSSTGANVSWGSVDSTGALYASAVAYSGFFGTFNATPLQLVTNGTARVTLDTSGNLGIGTTSPGVKLVINGAQGTEGAMGIVSQMISTTAYNASPIAGISLGTTYNAGGSVAGMGGIAVGKENATDGNYSGYLGLYTRANGGSTTEKARIDSSGNLGLGVTPSAWGSAYRAIQSQVGGFALSNDATSNNQMRLSSNAYNNGTNWIYYGTSTATSYEQRVGEHRWYSAPNGTAGTAITFTQAMTLNASGNLGLGVTPSAWATVKAYQVGNTSIYGYTGESGYQNNAYFNAGWKYIANGYASQYLQQTGGHVFQVAASGTAGNAITFTNGLTINGSGAFGVGSGTSYGTSGQVLLSGGSSASPTWSLVNLASSVTGTLPVANGGTGLTSTPTNGQLLIGNGTGYTASTLTAGSNITITNSSGGITIASSGGGGSSGAGNAYAWFMV